MSVQVKRVMMATLVLVVSCGPGEDDPVEQDPAVACVMDTDCKGSRICQSSECVEPSVMPMADMGVGPMQDMTGPEPMQDMAGPNPIQDMSSQPGPPTCATTCARFESCYPGQSTMTECMTGCEQNLTQVQRACVTNASTCADADLCFENPDPDPDPDPQVDCIDTLQCMASQYCWYPDSALQGECQANDFGKSCQASSECAHGLCVFDSNLDDFGECTRECTGNSECPESWACTPPLPGANFNSNFCDR